MSCGVLSVVLQDHNGNKLSGFIVFTPSVICDVCNDCSAVSCVFKHRIKSINQSIKPLPGIWVRLPPSLQTLFPPQRTCWSLDTGLFAFVAIKAAALLAS